MHRAIIATLLLILTSSSIRDYNDSLIYDIFGHKKAALLLFVDDKPDDVSAITAF